VGEVGKGRPGQGRRRRRTPEVAEQEIVAAAQTLLRERPFRELTVDEVMRRTELSRPSFYVYFRDRHDLVLRVFEHVGSDLLELAERRPEPSLVLHGLIDAFVEYGPLLRALADAAADDPGVEDAYDALVQSFVDATAQHIERRRSELDAGETAKALVWMTERYLNLSLGREPATPRETVASTLSTIWSRVLSAGSGGGA
jgi:TetR/AcrR family transcriptional regulator, ethionamide resistance regulator